MRVVDIGLLVLLGVAVAATAQEARPSDDLASLQKMFQERSAGISQKHIEQLGQLLEDYTNALNTLEVSLAKKGDLDGVVAVRKEKARPKIDFSIPAEARVETPAELKNLQTRFLAAPAALEAQKAKDLAKVAAAYIPRLEQLKKRLTQEMKVDAALLVKAEIDKVRGLVDAGAPAKPAEAKEPAETAAAPEVKGSMRERRSPAARGKALAAYAGGMATATEDAVLKALRWLKQEQQDNGAWGDPPVAMTSFALLAFLAHGETPASEEFGPTVEKAIAYLLAQQQPNGRFPGNYEIPIASFAICEAYGMVPTPELQAAAEGAVNVIIKGQHASGGWFYNCAPDNTDDTSYAGWCVQALKAGQLAGIVTPELKASMARAVNGFKKNAHPDGGFGYTSPGQGPLTTVGALGMQLMGAARDKECKKGLAYLDQQMTGDWKAPWSKWPLYHWYFGTQCKFLQGGSSWTRWNGSFAKALVSSQTVQKGSGPDGKDLGYWESPTDTERSRGNVYSTSLCALMLEVYYRCPSGSELELPAR